MSMFVAGGSGFLGTHLGRYARGIDVPVTLSYFSRKPQTLKTDQDDASKNIASVFFDTSSMHVMEKAMAGHRVAVYAIHRMNDAKHYPELEHADATRFAEAAANAGIEKIVYMGGVYPPTADRSPHLRSRKRTGEALRSASHIPVVELRASMIIGFGSISWQLVSGFAKLSPLLALPTWMNNRSWPVAIMDVVTAIHKISDHPITEHTILEIPGPENISHSDVISRAAGALGLPLKILQLPFSISPDLTKTAIKLLNRAGVIDMGSEGDVAAELVYGLQGDLQPTFSNIRDMYEGIPLTSIDEAMRVAIADETESSERK